MGWLDFLHPPPPVPDNDQADDYDTELDPALLAKIGYQWAAVIVDDDDDDRPINEYRAQAVEYAAEKTGGSWWDRFWGG